MAYSPPHCDELACLSVPHTGLQAVCEQVRCLVHESLGKRVPVNADPWLCGRTWEVAEAFCSMAPFLRHVTPVSVWSTGSVLTRHCPGACRSVSASRIENIFGTMHAEGHKDIIKGDRGVRVCGRGMAKEALLKPGPVYAFPEAAATCIRKGLFCPSLVVTWHSVPTRSNSVSGKQTFSPLPAGGLSFPRILELPAAGKG